MANGKWKGLEPEYVLLGGILKQAIRDSKQASDEKLRREAWDFLEVFAPKVAERLRNQQAQYPFGGSSLPVDCSLLSSHGYDLTQLSAYESHLPLYAFVLSRVCKSR